jgi:hypothetical protein
MLCFPDRAGYKMEAFCCGIPPFFTQSRGQKWDTKIRFPFLPGWVQRHDHKTQPVTIDHNLDLLKSIQKLTWYCISVRLQGFVVIRFGGGFGCQTTISRFFHEYLEEEKTNIEVKTQLYVFDNQCQNEWLFYEMFLVISNEIIPVLMP